MTIIAVVCVYFCFIFISPTICEGKVNIYDCSTTCSAFTCISNTTLCSLNKYLSSCGCCHLCVKSNLELCGGPYGTYGVCGKGLGCTVKQHKFISTENSQVGRCRPFACLRSCRGKRAYPVCGSNGYVFKNICELKKYSCLRGNHIYTIPISRCINNRYCRSSDSACNFVMLLSKKGHFNYIWRQAYKCPGMDYCAKLYSYATWCASNGRSYSSVCQINVHSCILNKELQAEYKGLCSRNGMTESSNFGLLPLLTNTQTLIPTDPTGAGEIGTNNINTYNSSDPYSTQ